MLSTHWRNFLSRGAQSPLVLQLRTHAGWRKPPLLWYPTNSPSSHMPHHQGNAFPLRSTMMRLRPHVGRLRRENITLSSSISLSCDPDAHMKPMKFKRVCVWSTRPDTSTLAGLALVEPTSHLHLSINRTAKSTTGSASQRLAWARKMAPNGSESDAGGHSTAQGLPHHFLKLHKPNSS